MSISLATKQAYSEVYEFINMLDATIINKVPVYILKLFEEERDKNYIKKIDITLPIKEQGLKEETLAIIAMLNLEYLCEDEEEKQKLKEQYKKNQELVEEAEKIEFNIDTFGNKNKEINIVEYEQEKQEIFLVKILKKIMDIFRK